MHPDLRPVGRGYFTGLEMEREYLLSTCTLDRKSPFVAPSSNCVNIGKGVVIADKPDSR